MGLSPRNTVGVGDAENDHAFLAICECAVAVSNALPPLKERADIVTGAPHSAGVNELIEQMVRDDLKSLVSFLSRHDLELGHRLDGQPVKISPYRAPMLFAGNSGGGKSTMATVLIEALTDARLPDLHHRSRGRLSRPALDPDPGRCPASHRRRPRCWRCWRARPTTWRCR